MEFCYCHQKCRVEEAPQELQKPESAEEVRLFEGALRRRQVRLILGGKMHPDEATELKALFFGKE